MSTKIYNGYMLGNGRHILTSLELKEFGIEFRKRVEEYQYKKYCKVFNNYLLKVCKDLIVADADLVGNDELRRERACKTINHWLSVLRKCSISSIPRVLLEYLDDGYDDVKIDLGVTENSLCRTISDYIDFKSQVANISHQMDPCSFYAEICIIPIWTETLLLVYGDCEEVMTELFNSENPSDKEFIRKYGITYYGYWNNTDRPDNLSDKEWDKRGKEWEEAIPSGVAADYGLCMNFYNNISTMFLFYRRLVKSKYSDLKFIPSKEDLIDEVSKSVYGDDLLDKMWREYAENNPDSKMTYSWITKAKKEVLSIMEHDFEKIEELKRFYGRNVPDDIRKITEMKLKELIPNFMEIEVKKEEVNK